MPSLEIQQRLRGVSVFLSASVPAAERSEKFRRGADCATNIEEAVVSVARALFSEGARLVFGAHPSISPLLARLLGFYHQPAPAEAAGRISFEKQMRWRNPEIVMYQSEAYRPVWGRESTRLSEMPQVTIRWIERVGGEEANLEASGGPQAPRSLRLMRQLMLEEQKPRAMIAIGGMEGVLEEARMFLEACPNAPVFALETTGGAAALLRQELENENRILIPDGEEVAGLLREFWVRQEPASEVRDRMRGGKGRPDYFPYSFVARRVVDHIVEVTSSR